jgi:large subunit ribosomal protein L18
MARSTTYRVGLRRRRQGKTDYRRRTRYLVSGLPRLVVRRSNAHYYVHILIPSEAGDLTVVSAHTKELSRAFGWKGHTGNGMSGYLVGYLCGKRALEAGIKEAILDTGLAVPKAGSNMYAVLKGAIDSGLTVPCDEGVLPTIERVRGDGVAEASKGKESPAKYRKRDLNLSTLPEHFDETLGKIGASMEES